MAAHDALTVPVHRLCTYQTTAMEIREVESSHIFDTADPVSRFWETVCGGKDDNKPMPTVFHNAKDYVFHPDFWEEGIKKQFLECPREQINSTPENHTKCEFGTFQIRELNATYFTDSPRFFFRQCMYRCACLLL